MPARLFASESFTLTNAFPTLASACSKFIERLSSSGFSETCCAVTPWGNCKFRNPQSVGIPSKSIWPPAEVLEAVKESFAVHEKLMLTVLELSNSFPSESKSFIILETVFSTGVSVSVTFLSKLSISKVFGLAV